MKDIKGTKEELEKVLDQVSSRLRILEMIEERLLRMRELVKKVVNGDLADKDIEHISKQINDLRDQVILLDSEIIKEVKNNQYQN